MTKQLQSGDLVTSLAYAFGTIVVASLAGAAVGLLAPDRPLLHSLVTAAAMVGISVIVAGTHGLPHGWQVAGLMCQVALMAAVATLTWHRRGGRTSLATRLA